MAKTQNDTAAEAVAPKKTIEEMDLELKTLELEEKKLALAFQKANLVDIQEKLAERELKREQVRQQSVTNGNTLRSNSENELKAQNKCNHRKGGQGANGVVGGQGDDSQYAIMKHMFANGDIWIRCLRCGKTWKPPVRSLFTSNDLYEVAVERYKIALDFQTRNVMSTSTVFRFSDNGEHYREMTKNTTLR